MKAFGSFKCLRTTSLRFLISGWWFIRLSNTFLFPEPEPPTTSIPYGLSGIHGQCRLCFCLFSDVTSTKLIIIFIFFAYSINSPLHTISAHLPYEFEVAASLVCSNCHPLHPVQKYFNVNILWTLLFNM